MTKRKKAKLYLNRTGDYTLKIDNPSKHSSRNLTRTHQIRKSKPKKSLQVLIDSKFGKFSDTESTKDKRLDPKVQIPKFQKFRHISEINSKPQKEHFQIKKKTRESTLYSTDQDISLIYLKTSSCDNLNQEEVHTEETPNTMEDEPF